MKAPLVGAKVSRQKAQSAVNESIVAMLFYREIGAWIALDELQKELLGGDSNKESMSGVRRKVRWFEQLA